MSKILYYDCFAGISGDMNLGALVDLGVDPVYLRQELDKLNIKGFHLAITKDKRKGIGGTKATVVIMNQDNEKHRYLYNIEAIINASELSQKVKDESLKIFNIIANAESTVHQIDVQKVHFHEVGALDSIVDIVGAAICLEYLDVDEVVSSSVQLGGGFVSCDHGKMPVPAPATALIVNNIPVKLGGVNHEATTPTGAAILAASVNRFTDKINFTIQRTGIGIGHRDTELPNILRVYLAEQEDLASNGVLIEDAIMIECNIDDMNPEWFDHISSLLFEAGASEVFQTPVIMKKSRLANILSILSKPELVQKLKEIVFTNTTTIGLRETWVKKSMLQREEVIIGTTFGDVRVKKSIFKGRTTNIKPEYEDVKRLANENKVALQAIYNEINSKIGEFGS